MEDYLPASKVQKMLGLNGQAFKTALESGDLIPAATRDDGVRMFDPIDVQEYKRGKTKGQEKFLQLMNKAYSESQQQVRSLVELVVEPSQKTHKALLEENKSLRERVAYLEGKIIEVHDMYGEMVRNTLTAEIEAEKERQNIEMKGQAFEILKAQIPIITNSLVGTKLLRSLTGEQIEGLIEANVVTAEQAVILQKEMKRRGESGETSEKSEENSRTSEKSEENSKTSEKSEKEAANGEKTGRIRHSESGTIGSSSMGGGSRSGGNGTSRSRAGSSAKRPRRTRGKSSKKT